MKSIKYFILGLSLFAIANVYGQGYFSATYNVALPMGNTSDFIEKTSWRGFGLEAGGWLNNNVSLGLSFAYNGFYEYYDYDVYELDNITLWTKVWKYTNSYPLMGVVKYYFSSDAAIEPYIGAGIGTNIIRKKTAFGLYYVEDRNWQFAMYPELGFIYWISNETGFTFNTRVNYSVKSKDIDSQSYVGFNVGFIFYSF